VWISKTHEQKRKQGEWYFYLQLFCNTLWSIVFFGMHNPHVALGIVVALWLFIFFTIREFLKIQKRAAYLLFPYLAWVSFASVLNLCIVLLN
jgi:tryptophan-rich sensory protein